MQCTKCLSCWWPVLFSSSKNLASEALSIFSHGAAPTPSCASCVHKHDSSQNPDSSPKCYSWCMPPDSTQAACFLSQVLWTLQTVQTAGFSKPCKKGHPKMCWFFFVFLQHQKPKYVRSIFHANCFCTTRKILNQQILLGKQTHIKINEASFPLVSVEFCYILNSLMKRKYFSCI